MHSQIIQAMKSHYFHSFISRCALMVLVCCGVQVASAQVYEAKLIDSQSRTKCIEARVEGISTLFTFATGCSTVSINRRLLNQLMEEHKVKHSDVKGKVQSQMSDGNLHSARTMVIKELQVGGYTFRNVTANVSINDDEDAPLLLGQTILERMKWYEIRDNSLRFEPQDEQMQQAMAHANQSSLSEAFFRQVAEELLPYFRQGQLPCYYCAKLLTALQQTDAYNEAAEVIERLKADGCQMNNDLAEAETIAYYNIGGSSYNDGNYEAALAATDKANASCMNIRDEKTKNEYRRNIGQLYWFIYSQTDRKKAIEYEMYKP